MVEIDTSDPMRPKIISTETGAPKSLPTPTGGEAKKIQRVVMQGTIMKRKQSTMDKISKSLFGSEARAVVDYVVADVLVPAIKSTLVEMVKSGIERLIYGDNAPPNSIVRRNGVDIPYVSYSAISQQPKAVANIAPGRSAMHQFSELVFPRKSDATNLLTVITEYVDTYEILSVADFKEACGGLQADYTDEKYGWDKRDILYTHVQQTNGGWCLSLPRPKPIAP